MCKRPQQAKKGTTEKRAGYVLILLATLLNKNKSYMEQVKIINREIKFRAWDKSIGKFKYPELWDSSMPSNWKDWYVLQQYIGLKDRNGLNIYEGDIVKWDDCSEGKYWRVAKVVIDPDIQFRIIKNTLYPLSTPFPDTFHFGNFIYGGKDLEVIGNVFENKDIIL